MGTSRYNRQLILPGFGERAQQKLKASSVFVAGAGGLGAPVCYYLAAAGVGNLIVVDYDTVELSNLNRQILHGTSDIDAPKVQSAMEVLSDLNPDINIKVHQVKIDDETIKNLAKNADIIVDCLDNLKTRYVLNRFSIENNVPVMHAGIEAWSGQLTLMVPGKTPCFHCLFSGDEDRDEPKPVLGAVAGVIGTTQALEVLKYLIGGENNLTNKLLFFDALSMEWTKININKNPLCEACKHL